MARQQNTQESPVLTAKGKVLAISIKEVETKRGKSKVYDFKVGDNWYKAGFTDPQLNKGDNIEFEYTETKYGNEIDVASITEVKEEKKAKTPVAASTPVKAVGNKNDYWEERAVKDDDRQVLITFQASRNAAIAIVTSALQANTVALPKVQNKQLDAVLSLVNEITVRYFKESSNLGALKALLTVEVVEAQEEEEEKNDNASSDD